GSTPQREQDGPRSQCRKPKGNGKAVRQYRPLRRWLRITVRIRVLPDPKWCLRVPGEPVGIHRIRTTEPSAKLDTTLRADGAASALRSVSASVNGPEGEDFDWASIDWRRVEEDVRRLRQRIFTASQAGDLKKVRNLQKLMLRSRSNTLLSVRR